MNLHLPERQDYTLYELQASWSMDSEKISQWLVRGELQAHVWLPIMSVFRIEIRPDGNTFHHEKTLCHWEGYSPVSRHSCYRLLRNEQIHLRDFECSKSREHYCLPDTANDFTVELSDLCILCEDRHRFELEHKMCLPSHNVSDFNPTFTSLDIAGQNHRLGPIQAAIVRFLYQAFQEGEPWQNGKLLLAKAGSQSYNMSNIFKRHPVWHWIDSDKRGFYRLSEALLKELER